jgi:hypothetical protein
MAGTGGNAGSGTNPGMLGTIILQLTVLGIPATLDAQVAFAEKFLAGAGGAATDVSLDLLKGLTSFTTALLGYGQAKLDGYDNAGALVHGIFDAVGAFLGGLGGTVVGPLGTVFGGAIGAKSVGSLADSAIVRRFGTLPFALL